MRVVLFTLFLIVGCAKPPPQESCGFLQNRYGQRISWNGKLPIPLYLHQDFPSQYVTTLHSAMDRWENALNRQLFLIVGTAHDDMIPGPDGISIVYWMLGWEAHKPNEQARTTVYWSGSQLVEFDMRINDHNFDFQAENVDLASVDLESIFVHELGHVMGLNHSEKRDSVMAYSLANGVKRREPSQDDINSMKCEY